MLTSTFGKSYIVTKTIAKIGNLPKLTLTPLFINILVHTDLPKLLPKFMPNEIKTKEII